MDNLPDKITALLMRITTTELLVSQLQQQLQQVPAQYVPNSVNEIHLQNLHVTADRIENDVKNLKLQLTDLGGRLDLQIFSQKEAHNLFLIRVLWGAIFLIITVGIGLLTTYLSHFIH